MYDKFKERCKLGSRSCYAMLDWKRQNHRERLERFIQGRPGKLLCQECRGAGEVDDDYMLGHIIYVPCGWCEGLGYVTPHIRGLWLRCKKAS